MAPIYRYIDISAIQMIYIHSIFILEIFPHTDTVKHTYYITIIHDDALMKLHESLD